MEELEKIAIDFCIANGFDTASFRRFVKFAEDLVDKGVLVEAKSNDYIKELADDTKKLIVKLFPPLEFGEDPDVCELYESVEELEKISISVDNISDYPNSKDEIKALRILIDMVKEAYPETSDFISDNLVEPIESTLSSAGKEVKGSFDYASRDIETTGMSKKEIVKQLDDHIDKKAVELSRTNLHKYAACKEMAIYMLEQFKSSPASTEIDDISNMQDVILKSKDTIDVIGNCANCGVEFHIHKDHDKVSLVEPKVNLHQIFRDFIRSYSLTNEWEHWYREQLTKPK